MKKAGPRGFSISLLSPAVFEFSALLTVNGPVGGSSRQIVVPSLNFFLFIPVQDGIKVPDGDFVEKQFFFCHGDLLFVF